MNKNEIRSIIEKAFEGVTLEGGTSFLQTEIIDNYGEEYTDKEFNALPEKDITHDWKLVTVNDLDKLHTAHLDDKGFRYYIPALMCRFLDTYPVDVLNPGSMRQIGTLSSLYPTVHHPNISDHLSAKYEILNLQQRQAIAQFLKWLPEVLELDDHYSTIAERAVRNYWKDYLT